MGRSRQEEETGGNLLVAGRSVGLAGYTQYSSLREEEQLACIAISGMRFLSRLSYLYDVVSQGENDLDCIMLSPCYDDDVRTYTNACVASVAFRE